MVKLTRLREVRERQAISQAELAERAGISRPSLSQIERGAQSPYPATVRKIADALGVRPAELMEDATAPK